MVLTVSEAIHEALAYAQARHERFVVGTTFNASDADPVVKACGILANAVYLPQQDIPGYVQRMGVGPLVHPHGHVWTLDTVCDQGGRVQFAFFALLHPPHLISWTVARGTANPEDMRSNLEFLLTGRPYESPDFQHLLKLHDTNCQRTAAGTRESGFRRLAVGHSKAGAEVVELGLARPGLEVHAFNDGGLNNLTALLNVRLAGIKVTCHRIYGDIVSNLRLPVGIVRNYPRDPGAPNAHTVTNFVPNSKPVASPVTKPMSGPLGLFLACTQDASDQDSGCLHPTHHAVQFLGTCVASLPLFLFSVPQRKDTSRGRNATALAFWHGAYAMLRSVCTEVTGEVRWLQCILAFSVRWLETSLTHSPIVALECFSEACTVYCFSAGLSEAGGFRRLCSGVAARAVTGAIKAAYTVSLRLQSESKTEENDEAGKQKKQVSRVVARASVAALWSAASVLASYIGAAAGTAIGAQVGALLSLPLCIPLQHLDRKSPCTVLLQHWLARELSVVIGAQWGATLCSKLPLVTLSIYMGAVTYAVIPLLGKQRVDYQRLHTMLKG